MLLSSINKYPSYRGAHIRTDSRAVDTVLLVDDDPITCYLNTKVIESTGYQGIIAAVSSGEVALDYLKKTRPTNRDKSRSILILLDINMPEMNGFEFLEALTLLEVINKEKLYVAFLSSNNLKLEAVPTTQFRLAGYLEKPLCEAKLKNVLGALAVA